jgi:hypothetical protein
MEGKRMFEQMDSEDRQKAMHAAVSDPNEAVKMVHDESSMGY